jgi:serine/threonine protein kinase
MYESLRDLHRSNEEHTAHIMSLREIGLAKIAGSTCAVQLYSWIEGRPLEQHGEVLRLAPRVIARLGRLLAACLSLVHQRGIVHRDISPRNIILRERSLSPVLIDFGFASYTNNGKTHLPDDNAAPEVRALPARWSAAADVYALARTLYRTADSQHSHTRHLQTLLQPFLQESPAGRGTLEELARALENEEDRLKNREACELVTSDLARITAPERDAYSPVLVKRKKDLEGLALGLFADPFERALMVANLVNQIAESKGSSIGELVRGRSRDPAWVFQTLRNIDAHGEPDFSETRRKLNRDRASTQLVDGAETIGKWLGLTSLRELVKYLVRWEPPP